jgi:hypothetical protein
MKHIISVDVQQKGEKYGFILTNEKKRSVIEVNSLGEGFKKVMEIVDNHNKEMV